jgi:hypothetical protein
VYVCVYTGACINVVFKSVECAWVQENGVKQNNTKYKVYICMYTHAHTRTYIHMHMH